MSTTATPAVEPQTALDACIAAEATATASDILQYWHRTLVPMPWQTSSYAQAVIEAGLYGAGTRLFAKDHFKQLDRRIELRLHEPRPTMRIWVPEAAFGFRGLRRTVRRDQARLLWRLGRGSDFEVRVVPQAAEPPFSTRGAAFGAALLPGLCYLESQSWRNQAGGSWATDAPAALDQTADQFRQLAAVCWRPAESLAWLQDIINT